MDEIVISGIRKRLEEIFTEFSINIDYNLNGILDKDISMHFQKELYKKNTPPHISLEFLLNNRNMQDYESKYSEIKDKVFNIAENFKLNSREGTYPGKFSEHKYILNEMGYMPIIPTTNRNSFIFFASENNIL